MDAGDGGRRHRHVQVGESGRVCVVRQVKGDARSTTRRVYVAVLVCHKVRVFVCMRGPTSVPTPTWPREQSAEELVEES